LSASYFSLRDDWIEVVCIKIAKMSGESKSLWGCCGVASDGVIKTCIIWMGYDNQCYPMMGELFMERGYEIGCG
jgi:hypothetical protein